MLVLWQRVLPYITSAQSGVTFKFRLTCYLVIITPPKCQGKKAVCLKCTLLLQPTKFGFNPLCRWQHQSMLSIHKVEVFKYYKSCKDSLHISPNGYFLEVCASFMLARANIQLAQKDNQDKTGSLAEHTENILLPFVWVIVCQTFLGLPEALRVSNTLQKMYPSSPQDMMSCATFSAQL